MMRPAPKRPKYRQVKVLPPKPVRSPPVKAPSGVCHYCGGTFSHLTRDHVVPRARRGADAPWNIVWSCMRCNNAKADMWPTCGCEFCSAAISRQTRARRDVDPVDGARSDTPRTTLL